MPNRLINEKSPYLLQHAHNPVDWYPWGKEAFDLAKKEDKPIFLSIGYSTCHWCHVMETESFENEELAKKMNQVFVCIKIDREELPEVDNLYMEFAQSMMGGSAGWPLNVLLTPTLHPFFASTYLPLNSSHGMIGMLELVEKMEEMWKSEEKEVVISQSEKIVEVFKEHAQDIGEEIPDKIEIENTAELLFKMADPVYGGLAGAPKFPISYLFSFLLRYSKIKQESRAIYIVEKSLDMMHRGGIYDHIGGGFSRYSVDEKWSVPHFEKMLYDNALLSFSYLEAWQATRNEMYHEVSKEIIAYVLKEMTHPDGGFYSAEDADSEGHEGLYYTWTKEEIIDILGHDEGEIFCEYYDVSEEGNFDGSNILQTPLRLNEFMDQKQMDPLYLLPLIEKGKKLLLREREKRVHPFKDDKIITSWNGQMIFTLINASLAFSKPEYLEAALKATEFIRKKMWLNGMLFRRWRDGEALYHGTLDDYAFMIKSSLALFEATGELFWLEWAIYMTNTLEKNFKVEDGAFYQTDGTDPNIILRKSTFTDGAEPSGNAIHCENLLKLYQITLDKRYQIQAIDILKAVEPYLLSYPTGYIYHALNLLRYYDNEAPTLVFALNEHHQFKSELQHLVSVNFIPHKAVIWRDPHDEKLFNLIPYLKDQVPYDNKTTLYVCKMGVCQRPVTEISEMTEVLSSL